MCLCVSMWCVLNYMCIRLKLYRVSRSNVTIAREKVDGSEINKNVLYHFAIFAIIFELLNIKVGRIRARGEKALARLIHRRPVCRHWPPGARRWAGRARRGEDWATASYHAETRINVIHAITIIKYFIKYFIIKLLNILFFIICIAF